MNETVNVDPLEVAKFETMAHQWWDPEGSSKPLHRINPVRLEYIERCCGPLQGRRVLDVGCGGGLLSEAMARKGAQVTGIDASEGAVTVARMHARQAGVEGIDYRCCTATELAGQGPEPFDLVTCMELLEHVPDPEALIGTMAGLLKEGGALVLSTLNRTPRAWLLAIVGAEYLARLLPLGTHDYARFLRPSELARVLRRQGLKLRDLRGLHYSPLSHEVSLSGDTSVNYLMYAVKPGG